MGDRICASFKNLIGFLKTQNDGNPLKNIIILELGKQFPDQHFIRGMTKGNKIPISPLYFHLLHPIFLRQETDPVSPWTIRHVNCFLEAEKASTDDVDGIWNARGDTCNRVIKAIKERPEAFTITMRKELFDVIKFPSPPESWWSDEEEKGAPSRSTSTSTCSSTSSPTT